MLRKLLMIPLSSAVITLGIAGGMILSDPLKALPTNKSLDFQSAVMQDLDSLPETQNTKMRDGYELAVRLYGDEGPDRPMIVMLHGSSWHGMQFHSLATALSDQADIVVPDLRGHGATPERRGDVDYIGQFEDDLADLIDAHAKPEQKVLMLGHSSGGGLVVRFAGGAYGDKIDRAVLLAPFLKHNAPTTRESSGGWATVQFRRMVGLSMLNTFKITALNHLKVLQFAMPQFILNGPYGHTATTSYTFRLNTSFAPRSDYKKDIAALPNFSLIVGAVDEAFFATEYEPLMSGVTGKGRYVVLPDVGHMAIVDAPETVAAIREDLSGL